VRERRRLDGAPQFVDATRLLVFAKPLPVLAKPRCKGTPAHPENEKPHRA
jgi:hypothetical protein